MPTIKERFTEVFRNEIGNEFSREEVIDLVVNAYPGTNRKSVIPSDYCYNIINAGIEFDFHLFKSLGEMEGQYRCLGLNNSYTGSIHWRPKGQNPQEVGEWREGRFHLFPNAPQRTLRRWGACQWIDPRQLRN
jgi:hypothetical protein